MSPLPGRHDGACALRPPPSLRHRRTLTITAGSDQDSSVGEEVARAVRKVSLNPKHAPGGAVAAGEPVFVVNFPLEESFRAVDEMLGPDGDSCSCWGCRCDAVAFALNRYPARYGVEYDGRTHLLDADRELMREELSGFLDLAVKVVGAFPHECR